jgi:hypothetical protein
VGASWCIHIGFCVYGVSVVPGGTSLTFSLFL